MVFIPCIRLFRVIIDNMKNLHYMINNNLLSTYKKFVMLFGENLYLSSLQYTSSSDDNLLIKQLLFKAKP